MVETIAGGIALIIGLLWIMQALLFCYLDISNDYASMPFSDKDSIFRVWTFYDRKVKTNDAKIKRIRDFCLALSGYTLMVAIIFVTVVEIFNLK